MRHTLLIFITLLSLISLGLNAKNKRKVASESGKIICSKKEKSWSVKKPLGEIKGYFSSASAATEEMNQRCDTSRHYLVQLDQNNFYYFCCVSK